MDFDDVADELYGLVPGQFTATRGARVSEARAVGDPELAKQIAGLRRPTVSAWLSNRLARDCKKAIEVLARVGTDLRHAQAELSGQDLRQLAGRRSDAVAALVGDARALAATEGQAVSASILEEVTGTLEAALADPAAMDALRQGRLTGALHYSGLGFDTTLASPSGGEPPAPASLQDRKGATRLVERARREAASAEVELEESEKALHDVRERIHDTEVALKGLRAEEADASQRLRAARKDRTSAQNQERKAQRAVERLDGDRSG